MQTHNGILSSPIGPIGIRYTGKVITWMEFLPQQKTCSTPKEPFWQDITCELLAYFKNPHHKIKLQYTTSGTPFQKRVWQAMCDIPLGKTLTYGEVAQQLKSSPRAVGNACRRNPVPLIIPCHRIVAKQGLGGFAGERDGALLDIKQWLLQHEALKPN